MERGVSAPRFCYSEYTWSKGVQVPTQSQVKSMNVEPLRELLDQHFEGITEDMQKAELQQVVEDNWDELDAVLNPPEEEKSPLAKDLYTGRPNERLLASVEEE